jgi:hypothetical protein
MNTNINILKYIILVGILLLLKHICSRTQTAEVPLWLHVRNSAGKRTNVYIETGRYLTSLTKELPRGEHYCDVIMETDQLSTVF